MRLPRPRGPLTGALLEDLTARRAVSAATLAAADTALGAEGLDATRDEDVQLALTLCYELHYRGLDGVDERWEWEPTLLGLRRDLEAAFGASLCRAAAAPAPTGEPVDVQLRRLLDEADGPSLSRHMQRRGTLEHYRELAVHRSVYQLKEADAHTFGIPRLSGRAKAALVEIQMDEYGGGRPDRVHATLFADTMRALGLDDTYGAYVDAVPAVTLATVNLGSWLGLHRRLRGALLGHLTVFEMDSSVPSRRYGDGLRRLGLGRDATFFFDEHVQADAVHDVVASVDMCGSLVAEEPTLLADVLFGAAACLLVEGRLAAELLGAWEQGRTSLLADAPSPLPLPVPSR